MYSFFFIINFDKYFFSFLSTVTRRDDAKKAQQIFAKIIHQQQHKIEKMVFFFVGDARNAFIYIKDVREHKKDANTERARGGGGRHKTQHTQTEMYIDRRERIA